MFDATVAGNLGKDAELRTAGSGQVLGFSVAATTGFGQREQTNWVNCSIWGKRGEALAQYLKKGTPVTVTGEITTREYEGKTYLEMNVYNVKLQGGRDNGAQQQQAAPSNQQNQQAAQPDHNVYEDDIPFANPLRGRIGLMI